MVVERKEFFFDWSPDAPRIGVERPPRIDLLLSVMRVVISNDSAVCDKAKSKAEIYWFADVHTLSTCHKDHGSRFELVW